MNNPEVIKQKSKKGNSYIYLIIMFVLIILLFLFFTNPGLNIRRNVIPEIPNAARNIIQDIPIFKNYEAERIGLNMIDLIEQGTSRLSPEVSFEDFNGSFEFGID